MISNIWFFQALKSEALEGTGPNVAYRSERASTMSLSTRSLWLVKLWGMRSRTNSSPSSSKPSPPSFDGNPGLPDPASAGKERGLGGRPEGGNGKDTAALLWLWTWSTWISWASSTADIRVERSCKASIMEHQTVDQLVERRFVQPNSFPYLDSVDEGTSSELEILPKPNVESRPNP